MSNEFLITLDIQLLPEGQYLATSQDLPGLLAQGRTIAETIEIAQDVARKIIESYQAYGDPLPESIKPAQNQIELKVAVGF